MFCGKPPPGKLLTRGETAPSLKNVARILIVDDEPMVGLMIRRLLSPPHDVSLDRSGRAARARFAAGERFDVIVTDLNMTDGDGIWLRGELAKIDPSAPPRMLFLTGGAASVQAQEFLDRPGIRWLDKPFRADRLFGAIEEILLAATST